MKLRLTLLRHGHAIAEPPGGRDFDRPLSPIGRDEALAAGRQLAAELGGCDLLYVSPALRTRQTAEALLENGFTAGEVRYAQSLYLADAEGLRAELRTVTPGLRHITLVGHNPGLSDLAALIAPQPRPAALGTAQWRSFTVDAAR